MAINSKQKGNRFERDIANMLSERFSEYTGKPQSFRRNADSGSFWGGKNKDRKETHDTQFAIYGDLVCPSEFRFTVECKNYKTAPLLSSIIVGKVGEWDTWLAQAKQDAEQCARDYILIIKYNRTEIFCLLDKNILNNTCIEPVLCYNSTVGVKLDSLLKLNDKFFFRNDDLEQRAGKTE